MSIIEFLSTTQSPEDLQIWDYVSPSRLNLWLKCPLAFRRKYIDGIETPPTPSLFVGKVTHDVLDAIYRCSMIGAYTTAADVPGFVDDAWKRAMLTEPCQFDDDNHEEKSKLQVNDLITAYLSAVNIAEEKPLLVERKFEAALYDPSNGEDFGAPPLVGVVDLVLDSPEGPVIVDFKTAASASANCDLTHEIQLSAYSYLVRSFYGFDESELQIRQLVKTKTPRIVTHSFPPRTAPHFERFCGLVKEYLAALDRQVFNYRPSWNCSMCDHAVMCV